MKKSTTVLVTMLAAAAIATGFGFYVMKKRVSAPPTNQQTDNTNTATNPEPAPTPPADTLSSTVGWKTYENAKHSFSIQYPANLKAGAVSDNSVLGTFQEPVKGFHVGPLVLVVLKDATLKTDAMDYFNGVYDVAKNPPPAQGGEVPAVECTVDAVTNTQVVSIRSVSCTGEGGAAKYAYISGKTYDVFVDGYSKGYDNQDNGEIASTKDYATILSTFVFTADVAAANSPTPPPGPNPTPTPTPNPTPATKNFSVTADDSAATPSTITVSKGDKVNLAITLKTENVYPYGLEFRGGSINSGTIAPGATKTVTFTADTSVILQAFWPSSGVVKTANIHVMVQ